MEPIVIRNVETADDLETVRLLLREYAAHLTGALGAENICMLRFEEEVRALPAPYEVLLLAEADGNTAGCVLLKRIQPRTELPAENTACELKRLWLRPQFRGNGLGRKLTEAALAEAARRGYNAMYLDTVPEVMQAAHRIYQDLGFEPVDPYNSNPLNHVLFFRRTL